MTSTLHNRILELQDQFTESERRLAQVTLECIGNLAAYTGAELAQRAGVSKASAGRFFRRLGYENFNEVRALARDEADHGSPLHELAHVEGTETNPAAKHLANDLQNLSRTFERLDPADVRRVSALLKSARTVYIAGFRNGRVVAQYAWALLTQLRGGVALVPGAGLNLAEDLADLGPRDLLLVMDFRRRVSLLRPMVEHANRVNAKVVIITDPTATELPARSDVVLRCVNRGSALFDSYVAAISVVNHLCGTFALSLGDTARERLESIETLHDHYGDLHR
jgi:DNA-binding MurR/RpiR family transcriptional regulator